MDRGPTANQSGEAIKIITQTCKVIKIIYKKIQATLSVKSEKCVGQQETLSLDGSTFNI